MAETDNADQPRTGDAPRRWSFGSAAFDERAMRLFVAGRAVELELKPLEVLRYLLQRPGEAVSKDDLVKAVWPGRVISDSALTSTIAKLREALGTEQDTIRTVHGFGYRLEADVRADDGHSRAGEGAATPSGRRLTAIVFTDLVGYSALAHRDEPLALELLELHRGWVREILPRHGGREIETIGDAFLVEFSGALAAVECAVAIQRRFAGHNTEAAPARRMQLRIGIHAGDVEHKDGKVMGDGVNIAARIHALAQPGGICVSEDVQRAVRPHGYRLESLGTPALKNIAAPPALYNLLLEDAPLPKRRWMGAPPRWLAAAAAVVLAVGLAVAGYLSRAPPGEAPPPSVAVLPFENLSSDAENEYFADGLHDELLTKLAKIHDLKVISRTSVMDYKGKSPDGATRNLRDIGQALGVATILEGTVRRSGNRVRLSVQLIDANTDAHLWAETFERELTDVFQIQAAVAEEITRQLKVTFSVEERAAVDQQASANPEAYDLYLRARRYGDYFANDNDDLRKARELLEHAVALDPGFAEAQGRLAVVAAILYQQIDHSPERLAQSEHAIARALELYPQLPSAHFAKAFNENLVHKRFEAALAELDRALAREPNYAEALTMRGFLYRKLGRWQETFEAFGRAVELNPRHPDVLESAGNAAAYLRRYAEAAQYFDRAVAAAPDDPRWRVSQAMHAIDWHGDLMPLRALRDEPGVTLTPRDRWQVERELAMFERRFEDLIALDTEARPDWFPFVEGVLVPRDYFLAFTARYRGDRAAARRHALVAIRAIDPALEQLESPTYLASTRAYAAMLAEDAPGALRWNQTALANARQLGDVVRISNTRSYQVALLAWVGDRDTALAELEVLLAEPGGFFHAARMAIDPYWSPLGDDLRFKALIVKHRPKD